MKTSLLAIAFTAALCMGSITTYAEPAPKMDHAAMMAMCKDMDPESCKMMMREMVKHKELHHAMAEELMSNPDFEQTWQEMHKHKSAHGG